MFIIVLILGLTVPTVVQASDSQSDPARIQIKQIRSEAIVLISEVILARRTVGLAETMPYVEKIGRIEQMKDLIEYWKTNIQ